MKKTLLSILVLVGLVASLSAAQKTGCVLAQQGKVKAAWMAYKTASK